jgi:tetratricopeptide (TPR) repeat protein
MRAEGRLHLRNQGESKAMKRKSVLVAFAGLMIALGLVPAWGQGNTQVTGKVLDQNGKSLAGVQVVYTSLTNARSYKYRTDRNGEFSGVGLLDDNYQVEIFSADGQSLHKVKTSVTANPASRSLLVDLSKESPSRPRLSQDQIEAIKKQTEKAKNMNVLIQQANDAVNARNWQQAIPPLQQLVAADPTRWEFYSALGDAQLNTGQYDRAVENYQKGIQAAASNTAVDPQKKAGIAKMLTNEGNAYLKLHRNSEAVAAYTKAAAMDPNPGTAYFNLCATQYNAGNMDGAVTACDKAIAADPTKADAYFIKGSAMYGNGKLDAANKYVVPPGTIEALNKYLELAPDGSHAADVIAMLEALGAKVETTYKQRKK